MAAERAGRMAEAAAAYEKLLASDDAHTAVLAPRLVRLYIQQNRPERALAWAHKVMTGRPDPEAYLAGVFAQLGQWKEAELLLCNTVRDVTDPQRRVSLHWQLADVYEHQGRREAALQALSAASEAAQGSSLKSAASARLETRRIRFAATNAQETVTLSHEEAKP